MKFRRFMAGFRGGSNVEKASGGGSDRCKVDCREPQRKTAGRKAMLVQSLRKYLTQRSVVGIA